MTEELMSRRSALSLAAVIGGAGALTLFGGVGSSNAAVGVPARSLEVMHGGTLKTTRLTAPTKIIKTHVDVVTSLTPRSFVRVPDGSKYGKIAVGCTGLSQQFQMLDLNNGRFLSSNSKVKANSAGIQNIAYSTKHKKLVFTLGNMIFEADPNNSKVKEMGNISAGATVGYFAEEDVDGSIWMGNYKDGNLTRYNPKTGVRDRTARVDKNATYTRSMSISGDKVYAGTGSVGPKVAIINRKTMKVERTVSVPRSGENSFIHGLSAFGDNLVMVSHENATPVNITTLWNPKTDRFRRIDFNPVRRTFKAVDDETRTLYYFTLKGALNSFNSSNETTKEIFKTPYTMNEFWVEKDNSGAVILSMVGKDESGNYHFMIANTSTKKILHDVKLGIKESAYKVQTMHASSDNKLYVSGYQGNGVQSIDMATGARKRDLISSPAAQVESFLDFDNNSLWMGSYGSSVVIDMNRKDMSMKKVATLRIPYMQSRPMGLAKTTSKIVVGSVPEYGRRDGAIVVMGFDGKIDHAVQNIIKDQSIVGLVGEGDFVYGTTSILPGMGVEPAAKTAVVFKYNVKTKKMIWQQAFNKETEITCPILANGRLYVSVANGVITLNKSSGKSSGSYLVAKRNNKTGWKNTHLSYSPKHNKLVHSSGGVINVIDISKNQMWEALRGTGTAYAVVHQSTGRAFVSRDSTNVIEFSLVPESNQTVKSANTVLLFNGKDVFMRVPKVGVLGAETKILTTKKTILSVHNVDFYRRGYQDIITIYTDGYMDIHKANQYGGFAAPVTIGTGWKNYRVTMGNQLNKTPVIIAISKNDLRGYSYPVSTVGRINSGGRTALGSVKTFNKNSIPVLVDDCKVLIVDDGKKNQSFRLNATATAIGAPSTSKTTPIAGLQTITSGDRMYRDHVPGIFYIDAKGVGRYISYNISGTGQIAGIIETKIGTNRKLSAAK